MLNRKAVWMVGVMAATYTSMSAAHHSVAMFDFTKKIEVEGTVKEWQWTNPHVWLQLLVTDSDGKQIEHGFEIGAPNTMIRGGFRKTSFKAGDKVKLIALPRRDGSVGGLFLCGKTVAGELLYFPAYGSNVPLPDECKNLP